MGICVIPNCLYFQNSIWVEQFCSYCCNRVAWEGEQRWQQRVCPSLETSTRMCQAFGPLVCPPWPHALLEDSPQHQTCKACAFYGLIYPLPFPVKPRAWSPLGWLQPFAAPFFNFIFLWILVKQAYRARSCIISGSRSLCLHWAVVSKAVPGWAHRLCPRTVPDGAVGENGHRWAAQWDGK